MSQLRSQSYLNDYSTAVKHKAYIDIEVTMDSLINKAISDKHYLEVAKLTNTISSKLYNHDKNYKKALKYSLIETDAYEALNLKNEDYIKALYNLGLTYYKLRNYSASLKQHSKIISLNTSLSNTLESYIETGKCYYRLGAFYKAEEFYKKAISIIEKENDLVKLTSTYFGLAIVYNRMWTKHGQDKQFPLLQKLETLKSKVKFTARQQLALNNYYGNYYNHPDTYNFNKSRYYYLKNLDLAIKLNNTTYKCATSNNLGDIYNEAKRDSALFYLKKSLIYCEGNDSNYYTYHQMSFAYLNQNKLDKALEYINKSIHALNPIKEESNLPSVKDFKAISDKINLMFSFDRKAEILLKLYKKDGEIEHVEDALEQLTLIDTFIDVIEDNATEEQSQLHWRENASKTYSKAITCATILNRPDLAFYFNEKSKALLLTESILKNDLSARLPKGIIQKENTFKKNILKLESDLKETQNTILKDSLFTLKFEYQKFTDSLKINFPEYYNNKSKTQLYSLNAAKQQLNDNTFVISYNWNTSEENNTIQGLAFSKSLTQSFTITNANQIKEAVTIYRQFLSRPHDTKKDSDGFKQVAYTLFKSLFPDTIRHLLKDKHILIIPDGDLQNIPFEALITNKNSTDYLIKTNTVSYAYSMSFLLHNQSIKRVTNTDFTGFAPVTFNYKDLSNLNESETELNGIHSIVAGQKHLKTDANKAAFLKEASQSKIIHLATHAQVSSDPWVAFSDTSLKLHELYTHKTNADLVVLSACNTAVGEQFQGEGVFNLARGFFYSGANSVISSHWSVNDASTSTIMQDFYSNLKQGESKSEALRHAQLSYLDNHELSQASPYYWAPFVLVGDYTNATFETHYNVYIFLFLGIILILLVLKFFIKK